MWYEDFESGLADASSNWDNFFPGSGFTWNLPSADSGYANYAGTSANVHYSAALKSDIYDDSDDFSGLGARFGEATVAGYVVIGGVPGGISNIFFGSDKMLGGTDAFDSCESGVSYGSQFGFYAHPTKVQGALLNLVVEDIDSDSVRVSAFLSNSDGAVLTGCNDQGDLDGNQIDCVVTCTDDASNSPRIASGRATFISQNTVGAVQQPVTDNVQDFLACEGSGIGFPL